MILQSEESWNCYYQEDFLSAKCQHFLFYYRDYDDSAGKYLLIDDKSTGGIIILPGINSS
jgi:hypothetical protein